MSTKLRLLVITILGLGVALVSLAAQQNDRKKYALLIGVSQYDKAELNDLKYSENDVTELAALLEESGYERVVLMTQTLGAKQARYLPTAANIRRTLKGFLQVRKPADSVIVAFAGHGIQVQNEPYFCPMDARPTKNENLLSVNQIYDELRACRAGVRLLLVDACRNQPLAAAARARAEVELDSLTRPQILKPPTGVAVLFSCQAGQKAYESETLKHGVFFHYVLQGLRGKAANDKGLVTIKKLSSYVESVTDHVQREFGEDYIQQPTFKGELQGAVALLAVPAPITQLAKKPFTNSIGMKLVYIPPGKFTIGSPPGEKDRLDNEQQREVEISRGFYMGAYEVTQDEYEKVIGKNPSWFSSGGGGKDGVAGLDTRRFPVEKVSWDDAMRFCKELSGKEGKSYDLPTEAEWEYACRAGTTSPFQFGEILNGREANCDGNYPYGTDVKGPYLKRTCEVGSYAANNFGLYDMHGNVWERCKDYYAESPLRDPQGAASGTVRVLRGGSWLNGAGGCRSAFRGGGEPGYRSLNIGFRVVLRVP